MQKIFSTDFTIPHNAERIHYFPLLSWILVSSQSCLEQPKQVTGQINLPTKCIRVLFMSLIIPPFSYCSWGSHGKNTEIICHSHSLNDWNNHEGVVTHLEPDILECEVKWVLEIITMGFPCGSAGKESACNWGGPGFDPWVGKISWRRERLPTPVFWPGEFPHDSVHGVTESWTWLSNFTSLHFKLMEVM